MLSKKTLKKSLKTLISITCALALALCLPFNGFAAESIAADNTPSAAESQGADSSATTSGSQLSLMAASNYDFVANKKGTVISQSNGSLSINRISYENETSMSGKDDGAWTIMVYMCGSDLESDGGAATSDITEMLAAKGVSGNVKVVIETGGCKKWNSTYGIANDKIQRWVIDYSSGNPTLTLTQTLDNANMGSSSTLKDFISYGVTNYPADKMGFIFWDHGGGSIEGACNDENNDNDCLTLAEIDEAFVTDFASRTDRFEFIGFDTCLMGTFETANMLTPYARYMFGSEEKEPGCGWYYTAIMNTLISYANGNATYDMDSFSKVLCDNFYDGCKKADDYKESTLACFNLSKMNDAITTLNNCFKTIAEKCTLKEIAEAATSADNYGGNTTKAGYCNMIDILDFVQNLASKNNDVKTNVLSTAQSTINGLVVYKIHGTSHAKANGISMYYPLCVQGSKADGTAYGNTELNTFATVCPMNYYFSLVDQLANSTVNTQANAAAEALRAASQDSEDTQKSQVSRCKSINISGLETNQGEYEDLTKGTLGVQSIHFNQDGYLTLRFKNFDNVNYALGALYMEVNNEDGHEYYLGTTDDVVYGESANTVEDNFDGYWPSVVADDGNTVYLPLEVSNMSDTEDESVTTYTCPAKMNGTDVVLRIESTCPSKEDTWSWSILGYTEKTVNGIADRTYAIPNGAKIQVVYDYTSDGWESVEQKTSDEFTYSKDKAKSLVTYSQLTAGTYYYGFIVRDLYGNDYYSEEVPMEYNSDGTVSVDRNMVFDFGDTKGDVNHNGVINIVDAQIVLDMANLKWGEAGKYQELLDVLDNIWDSEMLIKAADVNDKDDVTAADARAIQYYAHYGDYEQSA